MFVIARTWRGSLQNLVGEDAAERLSEDGRRTASHDDK
jgi:hypothetical protein